MQDGAEAEHGHQDTERAVMRVVAPAPWRPHVVLLPGTTSTASYCITFGRASSTKPSLHPQGPT